jgi:RND family efflux transporter MFP subunit
MLRVRIGLLLTALLPAGQTLAAGVEGVVQWSRRVELSVPVSGVVAQVGVQTGDKVSRNQVLLALEEAPFRAAVQQAEAQLAQRKFERDERQRDYKQAQELYDRTVLSTVELENAKTRHAHAEAAFQEMRAALDRARYQLRVSVIRAPFDGRVVQCQAEPGQTVIAELKPVPLLAVAAAGEYIARIQLPEERIAGLEAGRAVNVSVAGNRYAGKIKHIGLEPVAKADAGYPHYDVEVLFSAPSLLRAGARATVELP